MSLINAPAPDFSFEVLNTDDSFSKVSLKDLKGKWVVLFAYPLDFTFTCPTEIIAISDQAKKLKELGAVVLAGSVDSVFTHLAWTNTPRNKGGLGKLDIQLFSDLDRAWGKAYGCLLADGHHTRATYIINPEGVLLHASQNSPAVGRNTDEVVRLIEGYQFAAEHGEVCPANWKKGAKTIKPDPKASLEYFEAVNNA